MNQTIITAFAFLFYSFAVVGYASQEIFNRVFYALKKFSIPMQVSIICLAVNVILNIMFLDYGIIAISGGTAVALTLYALIMGTMVKKEIGNFMQGDFLILFNSLNNPYGIYAGCYYRVQIFAFYRNNNGAFYCLPL